MITCKMKQAGGGIKKGQIEIRPRVKSNIL